jgi:hypothetical protein
MEAAVRVTDAREVMTRRPCCVVGRARREEVHDCVEEEGAEKDGAGMAKTEAEMRKDLATT